MPAVDYVFPNDELGDISQNIVTLYHQAAESEKRVIHGTGKAYQTFPIFQGRIRYVYE